MAVRRDTGPDVDALAGELRTALTMLDYAERLGAVPQRASYGAEVDRLVGALPAEVAERVRGEHADDVACRARRRS